jgi:7,8-dihydro-6-hydroxymethylpterin dimethyltransferase
MKIIDKTEGLCDVCLKKIPAFTFIKNGRIFIEKNCPQHGKFQGDHAWDDPEIYQGLVNIKTLDSKSAQLTIAVTYRCNLNCPVCYAKANETSISDMKPADVDKADYPVIFLTGGEPTVHKDLFKIIEKLKGERRKVIMFSNGVKMANIKYVKKLKRTGLDYVIMQFDSVDDAEYEYMRGKKLIEIKKQAIENMQACRLPVYLQCVMLAGRSFDKMEKIFEFARTYPIIKTINITPLWRLGRYKEEDFVPSSQILARASKIIGLKRNDWLESTNLLCSVDKLISMFDSGRRRIFGKCNLKCLIMYHKNRAIPITKIFDTVKINQKINNLYRKNSRLDLVFFVGYFILSQICLNFILNKNFRLLLKKTVGNKMHLLRGDYILLNPLNFLTLAIFPTLRNLDFNFVNECNFNAISADDFHFEPGCIHRIKALRKDEKSKNSNK